MPFPQAAALAGCSVSVAIRREEKDLTLTREATGTVTRAGRALNGVYVRAPRQTAGAERETILV